MVPDRPDGVVGHLAVAVPVARLAGVPEGDVVEGDLGRLADGVCRHRLLFKSRPESSVLPVRRLELDRRQLVVGNPLQVDCVRHEDAVQQDRHALAVWRRRVGSDRSSMFGCLGHVARDQSMTSHARVAGEL